jgi:hypothetical protein
MSSPFPGMDPWLERAEIFPDLHGTFIAELRRAVNLVLPAPYYAAINNRVWVDLSMRPIEPDVDVLYSTLAPKKASGGRKTRPAAASATRPLVIEAPDWIEHDETEEWFLEIFAKPGNEQLVTSMELLSLSNKRQGQQGRDMYLKKQQEILSSKVNLVEIDLLRGGTHTTVVPRSLVEAQVGDFDYHVCIHQMDQKRKYFVYPWTLEMRLPVIDIPLIPGDPLVKVDLQAILDECYDTGNYERRVHYRSTKPMPPLSREQKKWAETVLKAKGI